MKVINKHPDYIKSSDQTKALNHAYTILFHAINKLETDVYPGVNSPR